MSLLIFVLIVAVVLCIVLWAIWYLPLPPIGEFPLKNLLMVIACVAALIVILVHAGAFGFG